MDIAVVIPAYNEAKHIGEVLARIPSRIGSRRVGVIVVDDGSRDKTSAVARACRGVKVIRHSVNMGKGAAAKTGCDAAYRLGAEVIVLMDGDGQHRPEDIANVLGPVIDSDRPTLAIGARVIGGSMPFMMRLGNRTLTAVAKSLFDIRSRDSQSGFRAFSADVYAKIRWLSPTYAMETEMLILASHHRVACVDVDIPTLYLDAHKGTTAVDGLRILQTLLKWKFLWFLEYNSLESFSR